MRTGAELLVSGPVSNASSQAKPESILSILTRASHIVFVTFSGSKALKFVYLTPVGNDGLTFLQPVEATLFKKSFTSCDGAE